MSPGVPVEPWWADRSRVNHRKPAARGAGARRPFGATWWGRAWLEALEHRAGLDSTRLPRGRSYARSGAVGELVIDAGTVRAQVQGSRATPYEVAVRVPAFTKTEWETVLDAMAGRLGHTAALLDGELPPDVVADVEAAGLSLLPTTGEVVPQCSCPDWAVPCKHAAAVCYLVADVLDEDPFALLALRGRDREAVLAALRVRRGGGVDAAAAPDVDVGLLARDVYARWRSRAHAGTRPARAGTGVGAETETSAGANGARAGTGVGAEGDAGAHAGGALAGDGIGAGVGADAGANGPRAGAGIGAGSGTGSGAEAAATVERWAPLAPLPAPMRPARAAIPVVDPGPVGDVDLDGLARLASDAAGRAWALALRTGDGGLMLTREEDLARRADAMGARDSGGLARAAGVPARELASWAIAWRHGGADGLRILREAWSPPAADMAAARAALQADSAGAVSIRRNRAIQGRRQLRLDADGRWWPLSKAVDQWEISGPPADSAGEAVAVRD